MIANLEHRHSYVRKNAVLALAAIYRLPKGELLVPDAPDLVERMLQNEQVLAGYQAVVVWGCGDGECWGRWQASGGSHVHAATPAGPLTAAASAPRLAPQDLSTRRNAFHMLAEHTPDKAVGYLFSQMDRVADWGDILQIAVLDLIRKVGAGG